MVYSLLAHRLHGGTSCYVPSLTERSRSNLHSLADKQACRLASLDYHAPACIFLRIDAIHHFVMIPYGTSCQFHTATSCGFHTRLWRDFSFEFETLLRNGKNIFFLFYDIGTTTFGRRHASRLCIPLAVYCQARRTAVICGIPGTFWREQASALRLFFTFREFYAILISNSY